MLHYTLSQPNSLEKLITNFFNFVFPFYIFTIDNKKSNLRANFMVIDFFNFTVNFYQKDKLEKGIYIEYIVVNSK